jgi:ATP-dependent DNA helicase RecQ
MDHILQQLQSTFGFDGFRGGQQQTISQLLQGQSSLAIFPTGSGKSLCYQFTALQLPNLTLVVSPLLALMKDQIDFLKGKGIAAASLDSSLSSDEYRQVMQDVRSGQIKILMISVERFKNERFREFIKTVPISMLVVDEAHCISEWGHNFRPDYLKLPHYKKDLNIPLTLLLTATATKKVKLDMAEKFDIQPQHIVQTGFYRANLDLSVIPVKETDKNQTLVNSIHQQQGAGIVYVTLQHTAERVAAYLSQAGISAAAYHAGFDSEKRQAIQANFMADKIQVIVATIAFGMGIDKSNIRFVMHYDLPKSIENYSQEIGRAGRDGQFSNCLTFANLDGINTVENFVYADTPEQADIEALFHNITSNTQNSQWEMQTLSLSKTTNIRALPLKTLLVQLEILGAIEPAYSYYAEYRFKLLADKSILLNQFDERRQQFLQQVFNNTKFNKLWAVPDLDACYNNNQLERTRVLAALEYLHDKNLIELESKQMTEVYHVKPNVVSKLGLSTEIYNYFKEKEQKEIKRIAALVRFFELDKCLSRMLSLYFDDHASPENCGHCSVCRGHIAKLEYSQPPVWPSDNEIQTSLQALERHLIENSASSLSIESLCRFFAGMTTPLLTKIKAKQVNGFGMCEHLRYEEIRQKIIALK